MSHAKRYRAPVNWISVGFWCVAIPAVVVVAVNAGRFFSWLGTL